MNTIAERIADFLKEYPPFDNLTFNELSEIASNIRVINLEKHQKPPRDFGVCTAIDRHLQKNYNSLLSYPKDR